VRFTLAFVDGSLDSNLVKGLLEGHGHLLIRNKERIGQLFLLEIGKSIHWALKMKKDRIRMKNLVHFSVAR
jgi:hypothetical protein